MQNDFNGRLCCSQVGNYKRPDFDKKMSQMKDFDRQKRFFGGILLLLLIFIIGMYGCKPQQVIVEKEKVVYVQSDSVRYIDSTVMVPVEVYRDYSSLLDTLFLSTSLAESKSWLDTNSLYLVGEIRNLKAIQVKYVEVDKWHTKDSIVEKEKPVPYEVEIVKTKTPTWAWWTLFISIGLFVYVGIRLYLRFKPL